MKRMLRWGFLVMLWALASVPLLAGDKSDLAARAATWEKEYNAGNLAAVVALYAADGCRMPPNQDAVHGSEAILAQLKAGKDRGLAKVKIAVTAAETSGDLGYGTGTYEVMGADDSHIDHGKWMLVEKKVSGTWKTQCDIFNFGYAHAERSDEIIPASYRSPSLQNAAETAPLHHRTIRV